MSKKSFKVGDKVRTWPIEHRGSAGLDTESEPLYGHLDYEANHIGAWWIKIEGHVGYNMVVRHTSDIEHVPEVPKQ